MGENILAKGKTSLLPPRKETPIELSNKRHDGLDSNRPDTFFGDTIQIDSSTEIGSHVSPLL